MSLGLPAALMAFGTFTMFVQLFLGYGLHRLRGPGPMARISVHIVVGAAWIFIVMLLGRDDDQHGTVALLTSLMTLFGMWLGMLWSVSGGPYGQPSWTQREQEPLCLLAPAAYCAPLEPGANLDINV